MTEPRLRGAPAWVRAASAIIRRLPAGRYHAIGRMPRVAPFSAALGPLRFACDLGDDIAREVCFTGMYAPQETRMVRRWLRPGHTFVDVGANWGYFALIGAERVGPAGRVLALEPDARMYDLLRANLERNRLHWALPLPAAAAEGAGTARLAVWPDGTGNRGVSSLELDGTGVEVQTVALDSLLDEHGLDRVDLVKIDVEGAEARVLRGMTDGLSRGRYRRILLELHPGIVPGIVAQTSELLRAAGLSGYRVDHSPPAIRRSAYAGAGFLEPLAPLAESESPDLWPHQVWLAAGEMP
jgi:FkbM family methyltransferase